MGVRVRVLSLGITRGRPRAHVEKVVGLNNPCARALYK